MSITLRDGFTDESIDRVLEDLVVRFVINCPDEDLSSLERVFFQIEEAHWFYTDFIQPSNSSLPIMKMKKFSSLIIEKCPMIWRWGDPKEALSKFGKYKSLIPVRGAALLNENLDKVLLVKGVESKRWSFPRGKISKDEDDVVCAVREVKEEIGFDCTDYIDSSIYEERTVMGKNFKIFIVDNVPEDYPFEPLARNEISEIAWKDIDWLVKNAKNTSQFFLVGIIIQSIVRFIANKKGKGDEEEIKRRVAKELKELLGVEEIPSVGVNLGMDLLEKLKLASQNSSNNNLPLQIPQLMPNYPPFYPFIPNGFPNGFPNGLPNGLPNGFPNGFPNGLPFPAPFNPMMPQYMNSPQVPQPMMMPLPMPQFSAPNAASLPKSSFSLVNQRSKLADSKLLLDILNKDLNSHVPESPVETKSETVLGNEKAANESKTNFLLNLFNKNSDSSLVQPPKKVKLLKRENPAEQNGSNELLSLLKKDDLKVGLKDSKQNSNELLSLLKKDNKNELKESNTQNGSNDLLSLLKKDKTEAKESNTQNGSSDLLSLLKKDNTESKESNAQNGSSDLLSLLEKDNTESKENNTQNGSSDLLSLLEKDNTESKENNTQNGSSDLLSLLKKDKTESKESNTQNGSSDLLSLLKKDKTAIKDNVQNGSNDLLSLLKKNQNNNTQPEQNGSNQLLSLLKNGNDESNKASQEIIAMLDRSESHSRSTTPSKDFLQPKKNSNDAIDLTFEDFEDLENSTPSIGAGQNLLYHDDISDDYESEVESEVESDIESPEESAEESEDEVRFTPRPVEPLKKKFQILKRGEVLPSEEPKPAPKDENPLLSLLKKPTPQLTPSPVPSSSNELLNLLKSSPAPPTQQSASSSLLSLLKKPQSTDSNIDDPAILASTQDQSSALSNFFTGLLNKNN